MTFNKGNAELWSVLFLMVSVQQIAAQTFCSKPLEQRGRRDVLLRALHTGPEHADYKDVSQE